MATEAVFVPRAGAPWAAVVWRCQPVPAARLTAASLLCEMAARRDGSSCDCVQTTKLDHNQSRLHSQPAWSYCCIPAFILAWQAHMVGSPLNVGHTVLFILLLRKLGETLILCGHASRCTSVPLCRVPCDASFSLCVGDLISKTCFLLVRHIYVPFLVVVGNCAVEKYGRYDSLLLECFLAHFWLVTLW